MNRPCLARDIMVTDLKTLRPGAHVCDGFAFLLRNNHSGAPVIDERGVFLGVFSEKCCMRALLLAAQLPLEGSGRHHSQILAKDFMVTGLVTLGPDRDVVEAIGQLLKHHISGAPVLDGAGELLGVLSERYSMRVLIDAAYDQLPTSNVGAFMNTDFGRVISEEDGLVQVAEVFSKNYFRRLIVMKNGKLLGQISRRDVLRAGQHLVAVLRTADPSLLEHENPLERSDENGEREAAALVSPEVAAFMDTQARTITEDVDLLSIAQIFLSTNYRRLPVLRDGKLVGQVSRRDVLQATYNLMAVSPQRETTLLYLSSLVDRRDAPIS